MKIYLASQSKQRRDLLTRARVRHAVVPAPYVEKIRRGETPARAAMRLALGKALAARVPASPGGAIVVGADTLIAFEGKILGKPRDDRHAFRMLKSFSGKLQWVYTGVALVRVPGGKKRVFYDRSKVVFKKMSDADIRKYIATGEHRDKAGSFGLQGKGAHLIHSTSGSASNIIGFPIEKFRREFRRFVSR